MNGLFSAPKTAEKPPIQLSSEDQKILEKGRYETGPYVTGGVLGTAIGFGIGHAVQSRYGEMGWIFTVTEVPAYGAFLAGYIRWLNRSRRHDDELPKAQPLDITLMAAGGAVFMAFHIWEIVDVWVTPQTHNKRYDELRAQGASNSQDPKFFLTPVVSLKGDWGVGMGVNF